MLFFFPFYKYLHWFCRLTDPVMVIKTIGNNTIDGMWLFSCTGNLTSSNSVSVLLMSYRRYSFLTTCNTSQMGVSQLKMCTHSKVKIWGEWGHRCIKIGGGLQECDCSVQQEWEASFSEQRRRAGLQLSWVTRNTMTLAYNGYQGDGWRRPTYMLSFLCFFSQEKGGKFL